MWSAFQHFPQILSSLLPPTLKMEPWASFTLLALTSPCMPWKYVQKLHCYFKRLAYSSAPPLIF